MKKRSILTRTDLKSSNVIRRTESEQCWKRYHKPAEFHRFKGDEPQKKSLNIYQQLTRSYSWLKQNVFPSFDDETVVRSNKKVKHLLCLFNEKDFKMGDPDTRKNSVRSSSDRNQRDNGVTQLDGGKNEEPEAPAAQETLQAEGSAPVEGGAQAEEAPQLEGGAQAEEGTPMEGGAQAVEAPQLEGGAKAEGGIPMEGGAQAGGGTPMEGGAKAEGGTPMEGGAQAGGGTPMEGGAQAEEGTPMEGGAQAVEAPQLEGGAKAEGGIPMEGGAQAGGGTPMEGGAKAEGGTPMEGGAQAGGGTPMEGGAQAEGGTPTEGGAQAEGGAPMEGGLQTDRSAPADGGGAPAKEEEQPNEPKPESEKLEKTENAVMPENEVKEVEGSKELFDKKMTLKEADQHAKNVAKFIEDMRASLAEYAKKEEMTEEDAKEMLRKQEELMAKLSEFEEITKHVQDLAGIENVSSSLLGTPVQCREVQPCGPTHFDKFPKVICFDRISQHELGVPNMIVCEPVCKEKDPCSGPGQSAGRRSPCFDRGPQTDHYRKGFAPDCDPERYIQKEISRELPSTEVIGMLDRQGMFAQPMMMPFQPQMIGPHPGIMRIPAMSSPPVLSGMAGPPVLLGMAGPPVLPGMTGTPVHPQQWPVMPGMSGAPLGPGTIGPVPPPGVMWPQSGMVGPPGQQRLIPPQVQPALINPQGQLTPMGPPEQGVLKVKDPHIDIQKSLVQTKVKEGEPEITIRKKELLSTQTTTRILGGSQFLTEHSEEASKETSIQVAPSKKSKDEIESQVGMKPGKENIDGLKKQIKRLQDEMKGVMAENVDLQRRILMFSPDAAKQMLRHSPEAPYICRKTLANKPICKLDLYRQLNLPLPRPLGSVPSKNQGGIQPLLQLPNQDLPFGTCPTTCPGKCKRELASAKVLCRLDIYKKFRQGEEGSTRDMETMVTSMEEEVKVIQAELSKVQEERRSLELQKKLLNCTAPAISSQSGKGGRMGTSVGGFPETKGTQMSSRNLSDPPFQMPLPPLRDLKEQYNQLQQDYQLKLEEVAMLRVELDSARRESLASIEKSEEAEARVDELIARLKTVEDEKSKITSNKDQMMEMEQQLVMAKQRYKEINEELEELRSQVTDQTMQTEDYRRKFLAAQESVEEQKRQIEIMELETSRYGEQVAIELQRVKAQFHSKLEEMAPLPELLRKTQEKLKDAIHLKTLAEKNCLIMSQNLELANEQTEKLRQQLDEINKNKNKSEAEKASLKLNLTDGEKKMEETRTENNRLRETISKLEEVALENKRKYEEKVQEGLQLQSQLETLREESARQVSRTKDRYENMRKSLQNQIFDLENQLAATRASAKAAQKDRDDIRQKMQAQIIQLNENFEQAQMRIRSLQAHVNYLKTSYTNIFATPEKSNPDFLLP